MGVGRRVRVSDPCGSRCRDSLSSDLTALYRERSVCSVCADGCSVCKQLCSMRPQWLGRRRPHSLRALALAGVLRTPFCPGAVLTLGRTFSAGRAFVELNDGICPVRC